MSGSDTIPVVNGAGKGVSGAYGAVGAFRDSILPSQSPSVRQVRQPHSAPFSGAGHLSENSHFRWTKWKDEAQTHCCV
jgi:hypothetical protein